MRPDALPLPKAYPFDIAWLSEDFELEFDTPVMIFCGENGAGKSTLIEALAGFCGFDEAGGGNGYAPVDHGMALDVSGAGLGDALRGAWLPKVTQGWFFRAETFFSVSRYLDETAQTYGGTAPDFLSHSHGEGFLRFFSERMEQQGIYFLDEPESALSPRRQVELLQLLMKVQQTGSSQVILSTHSPILMATPGADLRQITHRGIFPIAYRDTEHFRLYQSFALDPEGFLISALDGDWDAIT
ncbi:AAA family ATPase [Aliiroseovarius sp. M344]|uniref:AAA family ATPase n=1 Tax=Aliiroseovarius sp. M344 TaxID=2867010 RepID=UPI0021AD800B|nr:AAA family ATPase [Aliiroseovarius sp. M344]